MLLQPFYSLPSERNSMQLLEYDRQFLWLRKLRPTTPLECWNDPPTSRRRRDRMLAGSRGGRFPSRTVSVDDCPDRPQRMIRRTALPGSLSSTARPHPHITGPQSSGG